jgi:hypothetical protein
MLAPEAQTYHKLTGSAAMEYDTKTRGCDVYRMTNNTSDDSCSSVQHQ